MSRRSYQALQPYGCITYVATKQSDPTNKCTTPFGHPPQLETTRFYETHFPNVKAMHCLAKRKLGLARTGENEKRTFLQNFRNFSLSTGSREKMSSLLTRMTSSPSSWASLAAPAS